MEGVGKMLHKSMLSVTVIAGTGTGSSLRSVVYHAFAVRSCIVIHEAVMTLRAVASRDVGGVTGVTLDDRHRFLQGGWVTVYTEVCPVTHLH